MKGAERGGALWHTQRQGVPEAREAYESQQPGARMLQGGRCNKLSIAQVHKAAVGSLHSPAAVMPGGAGEVGDGVASGRAPAIMLGLLGSYTYGAAVH